MSAMLIATVRVNDPETYRKYTARTGDIIARHGGRFVVRGGDVTTLEGEAFRDRLVVLEFPDMASLEAMYHSKDYQEVMQYRIAAAESRFLAVETLTDDVPPLP